MRDGKFVHSETDDGYRLVIHVVNTHRSGGVKRRVDSRVPRKNRVGI